MSDYRDIGRINNEAFPSIAVNTNHHSQVFEATHVGEISLPYMNRSFISFTYGGKKIEDFELISTISGDRINKNGYANFNDTVTTYDNLDGQHYWATHYTTNQLDFVLSTDGIEAKLLDEFLYWFRAGVSRELILAEHPNRAIMARVSQPPTINLLPFEREVEVKISNTTCKTKTILYKGDISLSLIMDEPHWYSVVNMLGKKVDNNGVISYVDYWDDPISGQQNVNILTSKDALKILYEDGIPLASMIDTSNMLVGNNEYADGCISSLAKNTPAYFFYAGTAPAYTQLSFTLTPTITDYKITVPDNEYNVSTNKYNTITIESETTQTFRFTTPNVYTSYNKAIKIFNDYVNSNYTWEEIREQLRDNIRHPYARAWAVAVIEYAELLDNTNDGANGKASNTYLSNILESMSYFLTIPDSVDPSVIPSATFTFNSQTGSAIGRIKYRKIAQLPNLGTGNTWDLTAWGEMHTGNFVAIEEDVGDMLRSNYIIIQDKNYPNSNGKIVGWQDTTQGHTYSHRIIHDVNVPLTNLSILYKNMYL